MNKLRKILRWVWLNKERMVLIVVVLYLGYRVYIVAFPPPIEFEQVPQIPGQELPVAEGPGEAPFPPPPRMSVDRTALIGRNMFVYRPGTEIGEVRKADELKLLRLIEYEPGKFRARIKTRATEKWYSVGDPFEDYELLNIDGEIQCVEIWSTETSEALTICIPA